MARSGHIFIIAITVLKVRSPKYSASLQGVEGMGGYQRLNDSKDEQLGGSSGFPREDGGLIPGNALNLALSGG